MTNAILATCRQYKKGESNKMGESKKRKPYSVRMSDEENREG